MTNLRRFTGTTRVASLCALGLGIGLALSACNPSSSSAASSATPTASAPTTTASPSAPTTPASAAAAGSGSTGSSGSNAAPENVNGQPPVLLNCEGYTVVAPNSYSLDCFDAINNLENLHWTEWGQTAVATGTEELNYCVPSCTTHKSTYYPVSIQVDNDLAVSGKPD